MTAALVTSDPGGAEHTYYVGSTINTAVIASSTNEDSNSASETGGSESQGVNDDKSERLSISDKIALEVGLGVGIPTLIATIWVCMRGQ